MISLISIWTTRRCNHRCLYCFFEGCKEWEPGPDMSFETADQICRLMNSGIVRAVSFFGGEPMVRWDLVKYIMTHTYLDELFPKKTVYNLTTNGTLFNAERLDYLASKRTHINLSLDGTKSNHDRWRDHTYDDIMENLDGLLAYPKLQVLKTLSDPTMLYEDLAHIKELGFKRCFTNLLNPFGNYTYEGFDAENFQEQYKQAVQNLHGKGFIMADYERWKTLIRQVHEGERKIGCGWINRGLAVGPSGLLYPCLHGPSNEKFAIGDIKTGFDKEKERLVRSVQASPICESCVYKFHKCYETMLRNRGRDGVDPPNWHMKFELAKIRAIETLEGWPHLKAACESVIGEGEVRTG